MRFDRAEHPVHAAGASALLHGSDESRAMPTPMPTLVICPYCGHESPNHARCDRCRGLMDPLSRQASQNAMGPWFIRDEVAPFRPGCSYETLRSLVAKGRVTRESVLRGPSTRQFWTRATSVPGVAHLLGECHACHTRVSADFERCPSCAASFACATDRQGLGLAPVRLLPGHAAPEEIARSMVEAVRHSSGAARSEAVPRMVEREAKAEKSIASQSARPKRGVKWPIMVVLGLFLVAALVLAATWLSGSGTIFNFIKE
jgi:hypothetical protein